MSITVKGAVVKQEKETAICESCAKPFTDDDDVTVDGKSLCRHAACIAKSSALFASALGTIAVDPGAHSAIRAKKKADKAAGKGSGTTGPNAAAAGIATGAEGKPADTNDTRKELAAHYYELARELRFRTRGCMIEYQNKIERLHMRHQICAKLTRGINVDGKKSKIYHMEAFTDDATFVEAVKKAIEEAKAFPRLAGVDLF